MIAFTVLPFREKVSLSKDGSAGYIPVVLSPRPHRAVPTASFHGSRYNTAAARNADVSFGLTLKRQTRALTSPRGRHLRLPAVRMPRRDAHAPRRRLRRRRGTARAPDATSTSRRSEKLRTGERRRTSTTLQLASRRLLRPTRAPPRADSPTAGLDRLDARVARARNQPSCATRRVMLSCPLGGTASFHGPAICSNFRVFKRLCCSDSNPAAGQLS
jgi:hypothetical protein